jgi:predicted DNA-binding transcriptional regulator YafY
VIPSRKLKLLYLYKILWENTDWDHKITVNEIIDKLEGYGIPAERKAIYWDIELLKQFGLDIICEKERANKYYIGTRDFELAELKLLVDAVQSSKFITYKKSRELIKKIGKMCSKYERKSLNRNVVVADRIKTMNESIYYNVDAIHNAIQKNKQIRFKYFEYTIDKRLRFRRNGQYYDASPYALSWSDDNYYLIAYYPRYDDISNFRVDRMKDIIITNENRKIIEEYRDFNIADYSNKIFNMFSGKEESVKLQFDSSLINVVIDRFGKNVTICDRQENCFCIITNVIVSDTFLGWISIFGNKVKIISPDSLREKMKERVKEIGQLYK